LPLNTKKTTPPTYLPSLPTAITLPSNGCAGGKPLSLVVVSSVEEFLDFHQK